MYRITLIPGDGIGPDVADAARRCVDACGVPVTWDVQIAGRPAIEKFGTPLPEQTLDSIRANKVALKGPIETPIGSGFRSVNVALRKELDLYACLRPCKSYPGIPSKYAHIDLVVVRENTEDLYAGIEYEQGTPDVTELIEWIRMHGHQGKIRPDSAISIKPISVSGTERIVRFALEYAKKNARKRVTAVHKANIMKFTDGLFMHTGRAVARDYEGVVEFEDKLVDNMCMQLVLKPDLYDVLVLPNLYGDILSDLCAGLVGGLGVAPGANIGDGVAVFEPTHGNAPKYTGLNKVNPTATILSGMLMLRYLGQTQAADLLEGAVSDVLAEGKNVTYDLKADRADPTAVGTREMADAIIAAINKRKNARA